MKKLIMLTLMYISLLQGRSAKQDHLDLDILDLPHPITPTHQEPQVEQGDPSLMDIPHIPQPIPLTMEETELVATFLKQPADQMPLDSLRRLKGENPSYFQSVSHLERDLNALEAALPSTCDQERLRLLKVFCGWRKENCDEPIPENLKEAAQSWAGEMAAWHFKGFLESLVANGA